MPRSQNLNAHVPESVTFQGSTVTLAATSKGRSSSKALYTTLKQDMSYQLANIPCRHSLSHLGLRAGDPSRSRRVRAPRCVLPDWLLCARRGDLFVAQNAWMKPLTRLVRGVAGCCLARRLALLLWVATLPCVIGPRRSRATGRTWIEVLRRR